MGARALAAAGADAHILLRVVDGRGDAARGGAARPRRALVGTAAVRLDSVLASGHTAGEWTLAPPGGRPGGGAA